jgi:hypothetical protein
MEKVISVKSLEEYMLEIEFEDGLKKVIDVKPYIGRGISAALKDKFYFHQVELEDGGGIAWPNGYDFCPTFLRNDVPAVNVITA